MIRTLVALKSGIGRCAREIIQLKLLLGIVVAVVAPSLCIQPSSAAPIAVINANFDDTTGLTSTLPNNGDVDFATNPYAGWTEIAISTGQPEPNGVFNRNGPMNVGPGDITLEATSGNLVIQQKFTGDHLIRVDQTTTHVMSALDGSFTLGVDVGKTADDLAGYVISLYADNGLGDPLTSKTFIKTIKSSIDGGDPESKTFKRFLLTINQTDFSPYLGQSIGISLSNESLDAGLPVLYDTVTLDVTPIPEPASLSIIAIGASGLFLFARRRS